MSVKYKDYYETLGVPKTASKEEIRKAFRKLAREHHPDVAKDKKTAEAKFKDINEAYEVLGDDDKRRKYDELGANWDQARQAPPPEWSRSGGMPGGFSGSFDGTGFSDFFEQFFSGAAARGRERSSPYGGRGSMHEERRGGDVEADLLVTIEEALHGARKKISFRRDGRSHVETFDVRIPKGVREGQKIRLAGQGEAGPRRGMAGDLLLVVRFERHPDYRVEGSDLVYELELPVAAAVLGSDVQVPTPDGSVRLKIPAGSQPGKKFRLKGRGLPVQQGMRGDFFVVISVRVPVKLTEAERKLWEQLAEFAE